jgi:uncharacterized protein (TIGR00730 family)
MALDGEWGQLVEDLEAGFELLRKLPPAVTFFGGARIREDDPYYASSRQIGALLAAQGVPPRTGAGPGIMTSVPEGYRTFREERGAPTRGYARGLVAAYAARGEEPGPTTRRYGIPSTQGIKIFLPFEPELNPAIERSVELITFPIRRLMLYENALAIVVFPGGIGTLDELFEVWARHAANRHQDPVVLFGEPFYGPILAALRGVMRNGQRSLLSEAEDQAVRVTDDPAEVVRLVTEHEDLVGFDEDPEVLAKRLVREIPYVEGVLSASPAAVTVFGGENLAPNDPALAVAEGVLTALAREDRAVRVGSGGETARLAVEAYGDRRDRLQGFFLTAPGGEVELPERWGDCRSASVSDPLAHKLLLTQHTTAFVALPGRLQTLDEVFSVLCEMQCGKRPKAPIVCVGRDYWQPIVDACAEVMLSEARRTIGPDDLDLLSVVDDVEGALRALGEPSP